jgi:hypothetical protein
VPFQAHLRSRSTSYARRQPSLGPAPPKRGVDLAPVGIFARRPLSGLGARAVRGERPPWAAEECRWSHPVAPRPASRLIVSGQPDARPVRHRPSALLDPASPGAGQASPRRPGCPRRSARRWVPSGEGATARVGLDGRERCRRTGSGNHTPNSLPFRVPRSAPRSAPILLDHTPHDSSCWSPGPAGPCQARIGVGKELDNGGQHLRRGPTPSSLIRTPTSTPRVPSLVPVRSPVIRLTSGRSSASRPTFLNWRFMTAHIYDNDRRRRVGVGTPAGGVHRGPKRIAQLMSQPGQQIVSGRSAVTTSVSRSRAVASRCR